MAGTKQFLTFSQQVDYLKSEKEIAVSDDQFAAEILQRIGYFALMGGYKENFYFSSDCTFYRFFILSFFYKIKV